MHAGTKFSGLIVLLPLVVTALAGYLVFGQYTRVQGLEAEQRDIRQDIKTIEQNLAALRSFPDYDKFAADIRSEQEQAAFIDSLRVIAQDSGVEIRAFRTMPSPPVPKPKEGEPEPIHARYQPMPTSITVEGTFDEVRNFAYLLMRMNRLLNPSNVRWELDRDSSATVLSMVVTRYVRDRTEADLEPEHTEPTPVAGVTNL